MDEGPLLPAAAWVAAVAIASGVLTWWYGRAHYRLLFEPAVLPQIGFVPTVRHVLPLAFWITLLAAPGAVAVARASRPRAAAAAGVAAFVGVALSGAMMLAGTYAYARRRPFDLGWESVGSLLGFLGVHAAGFAILAAALAWIGHAALAAAAPRQPPSAPHAGAWTANPPPPPAPRAPPPRAGAPRDEGLRERGKALQALDARLGRGEITIEEHERIRARLSDARDEPRSR